MKVSGSVAKSVGKENVMMFLRCIKAGTEYKNLPVSFRIEKRGVRMRVIKNVDSAPTIVLNVKGLSLEEIHKNVMNALRYANEMWRTYTVACEVCDIPAEPSEGLDWDTAQRMAEEERIAAQDAMIEDWIESMNGMGFFRTTARVH